MPITTYLGFSIFDDATGAAGQALTANFRKTADDMATANAAISALQSDKADAAHTHTIADITSLQATLDAKAAASHAHTIADVTSLQTALDGKALASHSHVIADITSLQAALDGKAATSHTHAIADTTGLQAALDGKSDTGHTHAQLHTQRTDTGTRASTWHLDSDATGPKLRHFGGALLIRNSADSAYANIMAHGGVFAGGLEASGTLGAYGGIWMDSAAITDIDALSIVWGTTAANALNFGGDVAIYRTASGQLTDSANTLLQPSATGTSSANPLTIIGCTGGSTTSANNGTGAGGAITVRGSAGGTTSGGNANGWGGAVTLIGGIGGVGTGASGGSSSGGAATVQGGQGGAASSGSAGAGGSVTIRGGVPVAGGTAGSVIIADSSSVTRMTVNASGLTMGTSTPIIFGAQTGTKLTLYPNDYGLAVNASEWCAFSGGSWAFRTSSGSGAIVTRINSPGDILVNRTALAATPADGISLSNGIAATSGAPVQMSPRLRLRGSAWKSNATAASQTHDWSIDCLPATGAAATTSALRFGVSNNGAAYSYPLTVSSDGRVSATGIDVQALNVASALTCPGGATFSGTVSVDTSPLYVKAGAEVFGYFYAANGIEVDGDIAMVGGGRSPT